MAEVASVSMTRRETAQSFVNSILSHPFSGNARAPLSTPQPTPRHPRSTPMTLRVSIGRTPFGDLSNAVDVTGTGRRDDIGKKMRSMEDEITALKAELSNRPVQSTPQRQDDIANECPLCFSPLKRKSKEPQDDYTVTTPCGHTFHLKCLVDTRAHDMGDCPMCRAVLPPGITPQRKKVIRLPPRYEPPRAQGAVAQRLEFGAGMGNGAGSGGAGGAVVQEQPVRVGEEMDAAEGQPPARAAPGGRRNGRPGQHGSKACVIS